MWNNAASILRKIWTSMMFSQPSNADKEGGSLQSKIDKTLSGFIDQLFSQRARFALPFPGPRGGAMVSDPKTADEILRAPAQFTKNFKLLLALGHSRFTTNEAEWKLRHELTQRYYARAGTALNREKVAEVYRRRFAGCESANPSAITRALLAASTEIFHDAFGCAIAIEPMLSFFDRLRDVLKRLQYFSLISPSPSERSALEQQAQWISQQYQTEIERSATLKALIAQFQAQAQIRTGDFRAVDEFMMNFFAAIETTAATLSTAIDRLGVYQDAQERLFSEIVADDAFPQLECFINETLRYYPPVPALFRQVASDAQIEGLRLKAGGVIIISIIGVHHHPTYWKEPDVFDYTRTEFVENTYDRRAFIPFASGIRSCGGVKLAKLELSEGLKAFIRRFIVKRQGKDISFDYTIAMRPKSWDRVEIRRR
jgi:cytochrome P450